MLVSDADRDRCLSLLRDHFATGRLTEAQLSERTDEALRARSDVQLRRVFADLPEPAFLVPQPARQIAVPRSPSPVAYAIWVTALMAVPAVVFGLFFLLGVVMFLAPGHRSDAAEIADSGKVIALFFLPVTALFALSSWALARRTTWARGLATVMSIVLALTIVGLPIAVPALWGLWRTPSELREHSIGLQ